MPVGDPGQLMLGDCSLATVACETAAKMLVGLTDRHPEPTTRRRG
jgi:hypothetical protein